MLSEFFTEQGNIYFHFGLVSRSRREQHQQQDEQHRGYFGYCSILNGAIKTGQWRWLSFVCRFQTEEQLLQTERWIDQTTDQPTNRPMMANDEGIK